MIRAKQFCFGVAILSIGMLAFTDRAKAAEFGANTPYYEDDAWYDITEWLDANDYNPTDEAWWRWDDETYDLAEDTSGDRDSDRSYEYGGATVDDDWYDNYDPYGLGYFDYDNNNIYEFTTRYYDTDDDGLYDAYATYGDNDSDGIYENFTYYSFGDANTDTNQRQKAKQDQPRNSKQLAVTGQVQSTKRVQVRNAGEHLIVSIRQQGGNRQQTLVADLGKVSTRNNFNPEKGDKITVKGPRARIDGRNVILAQSVTFNGRTHQINRNPRTITGRVVDTRQTNVRDQQHLIAVVDARQNQEKQHRIAVDLGPADQLQVNIRKGNNITFSGFPVKVKDKVMMMAQSVRAGQQMVQINRQGGDFGGSNAGGTQQDESSSQGSSEQKSDK